MQKKSETLPTPSKSLGLAAKLIEIEPLNFQILTQTLPKNKQPEKNISISPSRVRNGKQKVGTNTKKQTKNATKIQSPKKEKAKTASSSDNPYELEEESNSNFVKQPDPEKLKNISKG